MSSAQTRTRLALALLAYMLGMTLIVTLLPFRFRRPDEWRVLLTGDMLDLAANVLLFAPLGFLYRLARSRAPSGSTIRVLALGALVSAVIEAAQLFLSARDASVPDVVTNALGAWLGALAFDRLREHAPRARVTASLALELPILGLVYLLVPLLCVSSLLGASEARLAAMLLLGLFGATLLGGVHAHYFSRSAHAAPYKTAAFAAVGFTAGTFALLASKPFHVITGALMVFALCWYRARRAPRSDRPDRRFERQVLTAAAPVYAAYLALLMIAPFYGALEPWRASIGFPPPTRMEILRIVENLAAVTVLGYIVAEFRGRGGTSFAVLVPHLLGWAGASAVVTEALRGFEPGHGASAARAVLLAGAVLYGAWLYHLQRVHAVRLHSECVRTPGG